MAHSAVIPIGGDHFTSDLSVGLCTPLVEAEKIKKLYGNSIVTLIPEGNEVEVPSVGDRPSRMISQRLVGDILEPRARELFEMLRDNLRHAGMLEIVHGAGLFLAAGHRACRELWILRNQFCGSRCGCHGRRRWQRCHPHWPSRNSQQYWAWFTTDTVPASLGGCRTSAGVRG